MSQEIIDYYRQVNEGKKSKPAIKQIAEQKTLENTKELTNSSEPFQTFVLELAKKIQKDKENRSKPLIVDGTTKTELQSETPNSIEEKLKNAAALIIKELKSNKTESPKEDEQPEPEPTELSKEESSVLDNNPEENNSYVKELKTQENKARSKSTKTTDSNETLTQQIHEEFQKFLQSNPNFGMSGSGGGTNAVQYARGGTMNGDLNVMGKYLSGGKDLSSVFTDALQTFDVIDGGTFY